MPPPFGGQGAASCRKNLYKLAASTMRLISLLAAASNGAVHGDVANLPGVVHVDATYLPVA